jgi:hypothetical protein
MLDPNHGYIIINPITMKYKSNLRSEEDFSNLKLFISLLFDCRTKILYNHHPGHIFRMNLTPPGSPTVELYYSVMSGYAQSVEIPNIYEMPKEPVIVRPNNRDLRHIFINDIRYYIDNISSGSKLTDENNLLLPHLIRERNKIISFLRACKWYRLARLVKSREFCEWYYAPNNTGGIRAKKLLENI